MVTKLYLIQHYYYAQYLVGLRDVPSIPIQANEDAKRFTNFVSRCVRMWSPTGGVFSYPCQKFRNAMIITDLESFDKF
jgi:hypothetical protein